MQERIRFVSKGFADCTVRPMPSFRTRLKPEPLCARQPSPGEMCWLRMSFRSIWNPFPRSFWKWEIRLLNMMKAFGLSGNWSNSLPMSRPCPIRVFRPICSRRFPLHWLWQREMRLLRSLSLKIALNMSMN